MSSLKNFTQIQENISLVGERDVLLSLYICVCCARLVCAEGGRASRQCKPRDKRLVAVETSG